MYNRCMKCRRKFNPDLRFCPYCGGESRSPKTQLWNYEDKTLVGHEEPVDDYMRKAYRQNGFLLLVAIILIIPAYLAGLYLVFVEDAMELVASELAFIAYVIVAFVMIAYGAFCAFSSKRPGAQVLASILLWVNPGLLHPIAFAFFAVLFLFAWMAGSSKSGSWRRPDASFLGIMTVIGIIAVIWGYFWLFNISGGFITL